MLDGYSYSRGNRPGILSAVGVASIIIASISIIVDFLSVSFANVLASLALMAPPAPVNAAPASPMAMQGHVEYVGPQGLSSAQRLIVINGLSQAHPISAARQKQLDGLLADVGQSVIQLSADNLTADRVATYVTDVREIPSASGGEPDEMFTLGSGRLQVSDDNAVFFPQNSPSPIRSGGGSYMDSTGTHLATEQIAAVVDRVQSLCNQSINSAQVSALEAELESTSQTMITPSMSVTQAAAQVTGVQTLVDGTIAVTTKSGSTSFAPTGQTFPGIVAIGALQPPWMRGGGRVRHGEATILMLAGLLSLASAGLLLACGVMTMRNSPLSRWMHLGYAIAKILIVMLSCCAVYTIAKALAAGSADARTTALWWMLSAGVGGIYPIVLLFAMNMKSVRGFLSTPTMARIF